MSDSLTHPEAIQALMDGKCIRSVSWHDDAYIRVGDKGIVEDESGEILHMSIDSFLEAEWQVFSWEMK